MAAACADTSGGELDGHPCTDGSGSVTKDREEPARSGLMLAGDDRAATAAAAAAAAEAAPETPETADSPARDTQSSENGEHDGGSASRRFTESPPNEAAAPIPIAAPGSLPAALADAQQQRLVRSALREELAASLPHLFREEFSKLVESAFAKLTDTLQESITSSLGSPHHAGSALKGSHCSCTPRHGPNGKRHTTFSLDAGDAKPLSPSEEMVKSTGSGEGDPSNASTRHQPEFDGMYRSQHAPPPPPLPPGVAGTKKKGKSQAIAAVAQQMLRGTGTGAGTGHESNDTEGLEPDEQAETGGQKTEEDSVVPPPNPLPLIRPPSPTETPTALPSALPDQPLPGELPSTNGEARTSNDLPSSSSAAAGPRPEVGDGNPGNLGAGPVAVMVDPSSAEAPVGGASPMHGPPPGQALRTLVQQKRQSCDAQLALNMEEPGRLSSLRSSTPISALVGGRFSRLGGPGRASVALTSRSPRSSRASLVGSLFLPHQAPAVPTLRSLSTSPRSSTQSSSVAQAVRGSVEAAHAADGVGGANEALAGGGGEGGGGGGGGLGLGGANLGGQLELGGGGAAGAAAAVANPSELAEMANVTSGASSSQRRRSLFDAERAAMAAKRGRGALLRAMTHLGLGRGSVGIACVEELPRPQAAVESQMSNATDSLPISTRSMGRTSVATSNKRFSKMSLASAVADAPSEFVPSQSSDSAAGYLHSQASSRWRSGGWGGLTHRRQGATLNTEQIDPLGDSEKVSKKKKWYWTWPFRDPNSFPRMVWDSCGFVLFALQIIYLPFRYAFIMDDSEVSRSMVLCDHIATAIDLFWLVDLVLNFTTGYYSMQVLVSDSRSVARHYLRTWFVVDLLASTPRVMDLLLDVLVPGGFNFWVLHFMYFIRVFRLPRLSRLMRFLERALKSREVTSGIALIKPFVLLVVISHCTACALWALGRGNLEIDPERDSWIKDGLNIENAPNALKAISLRDRYICAMYFSLTVMSTVGLGDITAKLPNERGLLMVLMITTSVIVGVAVNGVAQFVSKLDEHSKQTNERLVKVSNFLRWYGVPQELQGRVHAYLQQFFENQDREEVKIGLMEWIKKSDVLRADLNVALTGQCLARHRLLGMVPRAALLDICDVCEMVFHPPGEVLQTPGAEVMRCFYIRSGLVQLGDPERSSSWPRRVREAVAAKCVCGNTFMNDAVFCRKCGAPRSQATPVASGGSDRKGLSTPSGRSDKRLLGPSTDEVPEVEDMDPTEQWRWDAEMEKLDNRRESGAYSGGSFLGELRLFIGIGLTMRTAKCMRFTELISLDIHTFRNKLHRKNPELLHSLALYAAIEVDCGYIMARGYKAWEQHPDDSLLAGESGLHECAKQNAAKCAGELLSLGANVEAADIDDLTPAQIAASLKHREVFRMVVLAGARITDQEVLPFEALKILDDEPDDDIDAIGCSKACTSIIAPGVSLTAKLDRLDLSSFFDISLTSSTQEAIEAFRVFIEKHELDLSASVKNGTKGVHELYHEIKDGDCTLEVLRGRRLRRKVVLVRVRLMAVVDGEVRALVELQTPHWLKNPACRMARWPTKRVRCRPLCDPAAECEELLGSLGLTPDFIMSHLAHVSRATYVEVKHSMSYPGLETEYTIVETCLRIRKLGVQSAESIGLPGGRAFERAVHGGSLDLSNDGEELEDEADRRTYFWAVMNSVRADDGKDEPPPSDRDRALLQARQASKGEVFLEQDGSKESKGRFTNFHLARRMSSLRWNSTPTASSQSSRTTPTQLLRMTMTVEEEEAEDSEDSKSEASSQSGQ